MTDYSHNSIPPGTDGSDAVAVQPTFAEPLNWRLVFLRGVVWSLIGVVYAPLFAGLLSIFQNAGYGVGGYLAAAGLAGAIGAVLYGAREVSLLSTGLGVVVGLIAVMAFPSETSFTYSVLAAAALAALVGLTVPFPARCARHVPAKAMAGGVAGVVAAAVLVGLLPSEDSGLSLFALLALLVGTNGVLYVATVRHWVGLAHRIKACSWPCFIIESAAMAVLAGVAAGSVWMVTGPLLDLGAGAWQAASLTLHGDVPRAIVGGMLGGAVSGMVLQVTRFSWVHDI